MNPNTDPRLGRRKALAELIDRHYDRELQNEDQKAIMGLLVGEAIQMLANVDRIAHAMERIADAQEHQSHQQGHPQGHPRTSGN